MPRRKRCLWIDLCCSRQREQAAYLSQWEWTPRPDEQLRYFYSFDLTSVRCVFQLCSASPLVCLVLPWSVVVNQFRGEREDYSQRTTKLSLLLSLSLSVHTRTFSLSVQWTLFSLWDLFMSHSLNLQHCHLDSSLYIYFFVSVSCMFTFITLKLCWYCVVWCPVQIQLVL